MSPQGSQATEWWEGGCWLEPGQNSGILGPLTGRVTLGVLLDLSEPHLSGFCRERRGHLKTLEQREFDREPRQSRAGHTEAATSLGQLEGSGQDQVPWPDREPWDCPPGAGAPEAPSSWQGGWVWWACAGHRAHGADRSEHFRERFLFGLHTWATRALGLLYRPPSAPSGVLAGTWPGARIPPAEIPFCAVNQPPPVWNVRVLPKRGKLHDVQTTQRSRTPAAITARGKPGLHALLRRTNQKRR